MKLLIYAGKELIKNKNNNIKAVSHCYCSNSNVFQKLWAAGREQQLNGNDIIQVNSLSLFLEVLAWVWWSFCCEYLCKFENHFQHSHLPWAFTGEDPEAETKQHMVTGETWLQAGALLNILSALIYSSYGWHESKGIKELMGFFIFFVQSNRIH